MRKSCIGPGFRFHPTDVELVMYYLKRKLLKKRLVSEVIAEVNIYDYSPWDLPDKSNLRNGDLEWFFFCPKSRKYSSGSRVNRATNTGYWKATGKDREVKYKEKTVAIIKTLVFHLGHPPKGTRTDWVMHEYRMDDIDLANTRVFQEEYVLCRLFKKSGAGPKNGAQYGAPFEEEEWDDDDDFEEVNVSRDTTETLTNVTLTEPGPVIAASSEKERHFEESTVTSEKERHFEESAVTSLAKFGQMGTTKALVPYASSSTMTNLTPIEQGPSTSTNSEGGHEDLHANDDMITREDIALILHNNKSQDIEDYKGKKIMTDKPNEDKVVFLDSATLDDLSQDGFDTFSVDWFSGSMLDPITEDDLDDDLGKFFCG